MEVAQIAAVPLLSQDVPGTAYRDTGPSSLRAAADRFETAFLAEMLRHTGIGKMPATFNGGAGEAAFSGFMTWEYAEEITKRGTIGIADQVYEALKDRIQP